MQEASDSLMENKRTVRWLAGNSSLEMVWRPIAACHSRVLEREPFLNLCRKLQPGLPEAAVLFRIGAVVKIREQVKSFVLVSIEFMLVFD